MTQFRIGNVSLDADLIETFEIRSSRELVVRMAWGEEIVLPDDQVHAFVHFLSGSEEDSPESESAIFEPATLPAWSAGGNARETGLTAASRLGA